MPWSLLTIYVKYTPNTVHVVHSCFDMFSCSLAPVAFTDIFHVYFISVEAITRQCRWCNAETWWRHQMEVFSALLDICAGNAPVNSQHKGQWRGALMFSLIGAWLNVWVNTREAGDLRRYRAHYDVIVMKYGSINHIHLKLLAISIMQRSKNTAMCMS